MVPEGTPRTLATMMALFNNFFSAGESATAVPISLLRSGAVEESSLDSLVDLPNFLVSDTRVQGLRCSRHENFSCAHTSTSEAARARGVARLFCLSEHAKLVSRSQHRPFSPPTSAIRSRPGLRPDDWTRGRKLASSGASALCRTRWPWKILTKTLTLAAAGATLFQPPLGLPPPQGRLSRRRRLLVPCRRNLQPNPRRRLGHPPRRACHRRSCHRGRSVFLKAWQRGRCRHRLRLRRCRPS